MLSKPKEENAKTHIEIDYKSDKIKLKEEKAKTHTLSPADKRPAALVRKYGELYAQNR